MTLPNRATLFPWQGGFIIVVLCGWAFLGWGCARQPAWSNATPAQRQALYFREDAAYYQSEQYSNEIKRSAETVERLREQIRKERTQ